MCGVATPLIDAIIIWNQKLIEKEYIKESDGSLTGRDIDECIVPSRMGIDLSTLSKGMETKASTKPSPAKKAKN